MFVLQGGAETCHGVDAGEIGGYSVAQCVKEYGFFDMRCTADICHEQYPDTCGDMRTGNGKIVVTNLDNEVTVTFSHHSSSSSSTTSDTTIGGEGGGMGAMFVFVVFVAIVVGGVVYVKRTQHINVVYTNNSHLPDSGLV